MWSRSVRLRSPSLEARTRAATSVSDQTWAHKATVPLVARVFDQLSSWLWISPTASSSAASRRSTVHPKNQVKAAERALVGSLGRASALSSHRHCVAAGDWSTLSPRVVTAGMPRRRSAACSFSDSACWPTSTAMSLGHRRRRALSPRAGSQALSSSACTFSARSFAIAPWAASTVMWPAAARARSSSKTSRSSRPGSGAPASSLRRRASFGSDGLTGTKVIFSSPKVAPRKTRSNAAMRAPSERQFVPSVERSVPTS